jgi:hypothetical protein
MLRRSVISLAHRSAARGVKRSIAAPTLCALTLSFAGPLFGPGLGGDPVYCCRSGRCCCDSGRESADRLDFKAACGCARPGPAAEVLGIPLGLLVAEPTVSTPAPASRVAPCLTPIPRREAVAPPEHPPRRTLLS